MGQVRKLGPDRGYQHLEVWDAHTPLEENPLSQEEHASLAPRGHWPPPRVCSARRSPSGSTPGCTVAFETKNNATLWPRLQIREELGLSARQERLSLNINTGGRALARARATFAVGTVAWSVSPLPSLGGQRPARGHFYCQRSNL